LSLEIHSQIDRHHIDRHSYVIVKDGGGARQAGHGRLAAATAHRVRRTASPPRPSVRVIPAGKERYQRLRQKNFIGAFSPAYAVINDFQPLTSLSPRGKRSATWERKAALSATRSFSIPALHADRLCTFAGGHATSIYRCAEFIWTTSPRPAI
jgi:3-dehydroquinate synthase